MPKPDIEGLVRILLLLLLAIGSTTAHAEPRLARIFSDHAVLQRGRPIPVWGKALPGERVIVTLAGASRTATAGADGAWRVELPAMAAGGPHDLAATSDSGRAAAADLLIGDVWLCSGQSNMEYPLSRALDSGNAVQSAADPELRLLTVPHLTAPQPAADFAAPVEWRAASAATVGDFSAACYFMVRELRRTRRVPVGAIAASWGGTPIRSWMDEAGVAAVGGEEYRQLVEYRRDPAAANRVFGERWAAWWRQASGDAPGAEPWHASGRLQWTPVPRMSLWEQWGEPRFAGFDGMVWFRKRFTLTPGEAAAGATIALGVMDEQDQTFVNGVAVGGRYSWEAPREYRIAPGLLRAGENEILVNVRDSSGGGGMAGPAERLHLTLEGGAVKPLGEGWEYSVVPGTPGAPPGAPWDDARGLAFIHNGMIAPLRDFGMTGVAWYQGEEDANYPAGYADRLAVMMAGWRRRSGIADLPFLIVSLANFGPHATSPAENAWAELRDQQRLAVARDPHAALAVAMDLGEPTDIHPANKQDVGRRLARAALALAYGAPGPAGPEIARARRASDGILLEFTGVTGSLQTRSGSRALAFELCAETRQSCRYADAVASGATVRLAGDGRPATRVRYAWANSPVTNLYDEAGLPAGPFEVPVE